MSSTNRGHGVQIRHEDDFYATPAWCTEALIEAVPAIGCTSILDPCCGDGAILDVLKARGEPTLGIEINEGRAATAEAKGHNVRRHDALGLYWPTAGAIVTNPPFFLAMEFLQKSIAKAWETNAYVSFLLRLNWLGSKKRKEFHQRHPADLYIMSKRPSFTGGATDSIEYAWYTYHPSLKGGHWTLI